MRTMIAIVCLPSCRLPEADFDTVGLNDDATEQIRELVCYGEVPTYEACACDLDIEWSGVSQDLFGNEIAPAGFATVAILYADLEFKDLIADYCDDGAIRSQSVHGYVEAHARGQTSIELASTGMTPFAVGSMVELMWSSSRSPEAGVEMIALLLISDDSDSDSVSVAWP